MSRVRHGTNGAALGAAKRQRPAVRFRLWCEHCQRDFDFAKRHWPGRRFCDTRCARAAGVVQAVCAHCRAYFFIAKREGKTRKYCDRACFLARTAQENAAKKAAFRCRTEGCGGGRHAGHGLCTACFQRARMRHRPVGRDCRTCGKPLVGYGKKQYCDHACYVRGPAFREARERHRAATRAARVEIACEACGATFSVTKTRAKKARFCNQECYRRSLRRARKEKA